MFSTKTNRTKRFFFFLPPNGRANSTMFGRKEKGIKELDKPTLETHLHK